MNLHGRRTKHIIQRGTCKASESQRNFKIGSKTMILLQILSRRWNIKQCIFRNQAIDSLNLMPDRNYKTKKSRRKTE